MTGDHRRTVVIIPTLNEAAETVAPTVRKISEALPGATIFVADDSSPEHFEKFSDGLRKWAGAAELEIVSRSGEPGPVGGLGGAVHCGLDWARSAGMLYAVVMDADGQHPPEALPGLVGALTGSGGPSGESSDGQVGDHGRPGRDLVVATRHRDGGSVGDGLSAGRKVVSRVCASAARLTFPRAVGRCSDPMSGFFAVRMSSVGPFWTEGFKVLVHLMAQHPGLERSEVGYCFQRRVGGTSKAAMRQGFRYLGGLARLRLKCWRRPPRPVSPPLEPAVEASHAA